ncbi:type III PLP-dependent enzyme domain-containing protein [Subtercola frigoramans]|uniref:D-serine deaminase-like pyridoxal phosphate-dependent protein n=1 Tax=Subtercola frigoramans TaxID=120298 RepID=A0ABS2L3M5_9MICO|nr:alanine racemase [Subtercola frigoramans]MBM7471673.1 D-serine deaminase-like pyridoxal phosphate-dependent protein [Subtercola frigoramans]
MPLSLVRSGDQPWLEPAKYWGGLSAATAHLDTPLAALSLAALSYNAFSMLDRANGKPIRVASKSVRVREVLDAVLALPGYSGVLAYTLPEALWLAETIDDVVVGYPSVDRAAIAQLAADDRLASRVTLMIDDVAQLDLVDSVVPPTGRASIRVCIELDTSFVTRALGHIGVWRSPVFTVGQARVLAQAIAARPGFTLVGLMGYEAQIAGVGNRPRGNPARARVLDWMQHRSIAELADRRGAVVEAVREVADLEFVNGGGTGSLESTSVDESVTEIAAGSGLFGGHLFDTYSRFRPAPAAAFALSVVRKPTPAMATLLGGGWIASGPSQPDRLPEIAWPLGLEMQAREMAGEVQTPLSGAAAEALQIGDRVWLRHTKSGELSEHVNSFALVDDTRTDGEGRAGEHSQVVAELPSYRGEGKAFL